MISKTHRFHGYNSLKVVYSRGAIIRSGSMSLKYIVNPRRKTYRMAVVVSRKVHKSAVVRNYIRRRIYEIVRRLEPRVNDSYDLVFSIFSDQLSKQSASELQKQVEYLLNQAQVLHSGPEKSGRGIVKGKEI